MNIDFPAGTFNGISLRLMAVSARTREHNDSSPHPKPHPFSFLDFLILIPSSFLPESHNGRPPSSCQQGNCWLVYSQAPQSSILQLCSDCKNDKTSNISLDLIDNSPFHLRGSFPGPEDTPYQGGHFEVVCKRIVQAPRISGSSLISLSLGHCNPRCISFSTSQDEIHHQSIPPKRFVCIWRHLFRYSQRRLVSCSYAQVHSDLPAEPAVLAGAERSPGRRGCQALYHEQGQFRRDSQVLDPNIRWWSREERADC